MGDKVSMGKFVSEGKTAFQDSQMKQFGGDQAEKKAAMERAAGLFQSMGYDPNI